MFLEISHRAARQTVYFRIKFKMMNSVVYHLLAIPEQGFCRDRRQKYLLACVIDRLISFCHRMQDDRQIQVFDHVG